MIVIDEVTPGAVIRWCYERIKNGPPLVQLPVYSTKAGPRPWLDKYRQDGTTSHMQLIGLGYKAGVGKDWVAKEVLRPLGWQNVGFAWALKLEAIEAGFSVEEVFVTKPARVRGWLQRRGLSARALDPDYWVKKLDALVQTLHREGGIEKFVVTDCRFENEMAWVKSKGGALVKLTHGDRPYPLAGTEFAEHESEISLDVVPDAGWDAIIENGSRMTRSEMRLQLRRAGVLEGARLDAMQLQLV